MHFSLSFVVKRVQPISVLLGAKNMVKWKQDWYLSFQEVDCLSRSVSSSRSIALLYVVESDVKLRSNNFFN